MRTYSSEGCADAMCRDAERLEPPALGFEPGPPDWCCQGMSDKCRCDEEARVTVMWPDEDYARATKCALDILKRDGYLIDAAKFDNAMQHMVGILSLNARKV